MVVPRQAAEDAGDIIKRFPFAEKENPGVWDFQPTRKVQIGWKIYAGGMLLFLVLSALWKLIQK